MHKTQDSLLKVWDPGKDEKTLQGFKTEVEKIWDTFLKHLFGCNVVNELNKPTREAGGYDTWLLDWPVEKEFIP